MQSDWKKKVGTLNVGSKPFTQGETESCEFPSACVLLHQGGSLWTDCFCLFHLFQCFFFFFFPSFAWCVGFAQLVSGFLSICGCRFVCLWEEVSLGASYVAILNQNASVLLFNILLETTNDNLAHEKPYGIYQKIAKSNKWALQDHRVKKSRYKNICHSIY